MDLSRFQEEVVIQSCYEGVFVDLVSIVAFCNACDAIGYGYSPIHQRITGGYLDILDHVVNEDIVI